MTFILCYILSCISIIAYEKLQERRKENPMCMFYTEMKRLLCSGMCHPTEHMDRPRVLAKHPWEKAPLTLTHTGTTWRSSTACRRVQYYPCRFKELFTEAPRPAAPGTGEPACEKHAGSSITSAFSVANTSKLGDYSPELSIKSILKGTDPKYKLKSLA